MKNRILSVPYPGRSRKGRSDIRDDIHNNDLCTIWYWTPGPYPLGYLVKMV